MPSFSTLSLIATLACAIFTSAAPVPVDVPVVGDATNLSSVGDILAGNGATRALPDILADVTSSITPFCDQLNSIVAANATAAVLTPITDGMKDILSSAITEVTALANQPTDTILALAGKVLSITELAQTVAALLSLILTALGLVLKVAGSAPTVVLPLLAGVGVLVGQLLAAILAVVGGLLAVLLPLIGNLVPIILDLNLSALLKLLGVAL